MLQLKSLLKDLCHSYDYTIDTQRAIYCSENKNATHTIYITNEMEAIDKLNISF